MGNQVDYPRRSKSVPRCLVLEPNERNSAVLGRHPRTLVYHLEMVEHRLSARGVKYSIPFRIRNDKNKFEGARNERS
jgi:hypothetical protein